MHYYIDFDEVLFATEDLLFEEYNRLKNLGIKIDKVKYIQEFNWHLLLCKSKIINNSLEILKEMSNASILTRIHSLENEGAFKIIRLREENVRNDVILCPYPLKKSEVVNPIGNILVDDNVSNLEDWHEKGGIPVFFNKNGLDVDGWGVTNKKYIKIRTLEELKKIKF